MRRRTEFKFPSTRCVPNCSDRFSSFTLSCPVSLTLKSYGLKGAHQLSLRRLVLSFSRTKPLDSTLTSIYDFPLPFFFERFQHPFPRQSAPPPEYHLSHDSSP